MPIPLGRRVLNALQHGWNVFQNQDGVSSTDLGASGGVRLDRSRFRFGTERSIVSAVYNRIGIDVSSIPIRHVRLDDNERYVETIQSGLNRCLSLEANIDQSGRAFMQDVVQSMCDEGCVAIVPVDTTINPKIGSFDIDSMRVGKVTQWYPKNVTVRLYDQRDGMMKDVTVPKDRTAIIENPLYAVMNEPNSTLQRLINKLNLLDVIDEQSGSGKLDLLLQFPFSAKTEKRKEQAAARRQEIEDQLNNSKYGIAWVDGTEKVTQLNRPAENNLMKQIEYLVGMLFNQLGMTEAVFNGTAKEEEMINYFNRTIEPIIGGVCVEINRKFLTKTGRSQGQSIAYLRDPFKLVPVSQLADIADKFTRNEIMTSNEMRSTVGLKPSKEKGADELRNKNINPPTETPSPDDQTGNNDNEDQNGRSSVNGKTE